MARGPAGVPRPLVTTNLKYDVIVQMPRETFLEPPKAIDVLQKRVNAPQRDVVEHVKDQIGDVILAVNSLAHPSSFRVVDEEVEEHERVGDMIPSGMTQITWTYIIRGVGAGQGANTSTSSSAIWKLHEVLLKGNNRPIERAQKIREFDPGPLEVKRVRISTQ